MTRLRFYLLALGPGLVTAFADNDAGGITTYSLAGAQFGFGLMWVLLVTAIALTVTQETGARLALATGQGLAGLIREHDGDCPGAVALFDRVPISYPAGDAVLPSLLAKGRCLQRLSRRDEARELYARIVREHPEGMEAGTARQLLKNLDIDSGRH